MLSGQSGDEQLHSGTGVMRPVVTTEHLVARLANYGLSPAAFEYAKKALTSEPSRGVGQFATRSVCGMFSSPSQGLTLQYESRTAELVWLVRWELDSNVVGCRDQPPMIDLRKADKNGVVKTSGYTPDFLLFCINEIVVVEVKTESNLQSLSEKYPEQWVEDNGVWRYCPAQQSFSEMGLTHIVLSGAELEQVETCNLKTLGQVLRFGHKVDSKLRAKVISALEETAWLSIADILGRVPGVTNTDIFALLIESVLFADIRLHLLTEPNSCLLALDRETLEIANNDNWQAPVVPSPVSCMKVPDREEMAMALKRLERVKSGEKSRQVRRHKQQIREGKLRGLSPLQSLVAPKLGNPTPKISPEAKAAVEEHIQSVYMTEDEPTILDAWTDYKMKLKKGLSNIRIVCRKTYQEMVEMKDPEEVAKARGGKREGNAAAARTPVLTRALIAQRALERVSIDHCLLKIQVPVVESGGKQYCRRPWLTAAVDDATDDWLAFFLSFAAPSKRSLCMLLRNCAREHGRLPETIHSDRGADLRSKFWVSVLAHYEINVDWSPAGHSRFNAEAERLNKQIQKQHLAKRPGNTINYLDKRKRSKGHRPSDLATINFEKLFVEIDAFRREYNQTVVGTNESSPAILHEQSMSQYPFSGIPVVIDDDFLLETAYDTDHEKYKITNSGDIVIGSLRFSHPTLAKIRPKRSHTEVRLDPEDPYRIYCHVDGEWITALNSNHQAFVTRNRYARWAETIRVSDGRVVRDEAKQDGRERKALQIKQFDSSYADESNATETKSSAPTPNVHVESESGKRGAVAFKELREKKLPPLKTLER